MKQFKNILITFILLLPFFSFSQSKEEKEGDKMFARQNYIKAKNWYNQVYKKDPENKEINFKLALCYVKLTLGTKAEKHINLSLTDEAKPSKEKLYIKAAALQLTHQFDSAAVYYQKSDPLKANAKEISKKLKECKYGKAYLASPKNFKVRNLHPINSKTHDIAPKISADFEQMYFTSQRSNDEYPENIYKSINRGGSWSSPINVGEPLNSSYNDACIGLSADGQTMYLYKGINGGDIYESELKGKKWSKPKAMPFNTIHRETSICVSPDGKKLFFVRQLLDSKGNKTGTSNLFLCRKNSSGNWSKSVKLNSTINTKYDEESPFIHPDGKTLYFSSKGHSSMGGYDIFKTTMNESGTSFTKPINLGYPLNTAADERNFVLSANAKFGLYAAQKEVGGKGGLDIYFITMPPAKKPNLALLKGKITDQITNKAIEAKITITDNDADKVIAEFHSNSETGEYLISLPAGKNYGVTIEKEGHLFYSENIQLTNKTGYNSLKKNVKLLNISPGSTIILKNIFFKTGSYDLSPSSHGELEKLRELMVNNPKIKIQISGHTDNVGNEESNKMLSKNRAKSVVDYLRNHGISSTRMKFIGYGSSKPIAENSKASGRSKNRRTEFLIIE